MRPGKCRLKAARVGILKGGIRYKRFYRRIHIQMHHSIITEDAYPFRDNVVAALAALHPWSRKGRRRCTALAVCCDPPYPPLYHRQLTAPPLCCHACMNMSQWDGGGRKVGKCEPPLILALLSKADRSRIDLGPDSS